MKKLSVLLFAGVCIASCDHYASKAAKKAVSNQTQTPVNVSFANAGSFIPVDSANKMIGSYLNSIDAAGNDGDLRSVIIDAASLRTYLQYDAYRITKLKLMFAHRLNYINTGHAGMNCGYNKDGLTFVVAGYDDKGNYIFLPNGLVINHGLPCPSSCPTSGTAASDLLTK